MQSNKRLNEDYETALVRYHKAAGECPRDSSHSVAARRTSAIISTAANPSSALRKLLPKAQNGIELLSATLCPQMAAIRCENMENILKQSTNPVQVIPEILQYIDERSAIRKLSSQSLSSNMAQRLSRTKMMHRQLLNQADSSLNSLRSFFNAGDFSSTLKMAQEVIFLASGLQAPYQHLVEAYQCLALIHISIQRHDRAVNHVSQMINAARASGDTALFTKSLVILGVVHVSFHHYDALCRAWEFLLPEVNDFVPKAWMLHEMGRCHFECGRHSLALQLSIQCQQTANMANSKKWLRHGQLLCGQSLVKLGRFQEALETLRVVGSMIEEEEDIPILRYIRDLVNQVTGVLKLTVRNGALQSKGSMDSSAEKSGGIERSILKDHQPFSDSADKMSLKDLDNEISSIKIDDDNHSITTSTHTVNADSDLDSIASNISDETYIIRKDHYQTSTRNSPEIRFLYSPESCHSEQNQVLPDSGTFHSQSRDFFQPKKMLQQNGDFESCRDKIFPNKKICSSSAEEAVESLVAKLAGSISKNRSKSPERMLAQFDGDWPLFAEIEKVENLVNATESIHTGRSYSFATLQRYSLPSPRQLKMT